MTDLPASLLVLEFVLHVRHVCKWACMHAARKHSQTLNLEASTSTGATAGGLPFTAFVCRMWHAGMGQLLLRG
jgi:hypothetical protein